MADNLVVKLGADTSEFKGQIASAANTFKTAFGADAGAKIGEEFSRAFNRKIGVSDVARAALVSLGIDAKAIAENVARAWTGVTKSEEEAYKKIGELSTQVANAEIEASRKKLDAQQKLQLMLLDEQRLKDAIATNSARTAEQQLKQLEDRNRLLQVQAEIEQQILKANEEEYKRLNALFKQLDLVNAARKEWADEQQERSKKAFDDDLEWYKKRARLEEELKNLKIDALKPDERLKALQTEQLALQKKIKQEKKDGVDTLADEIKLAKLDKDIQQQILDILNKQTNAVDDRAKAVQNMNSMDMGVLRLSSGFQTYNKSEDQALYERNLVAQARAEIGYEINELQGKLDAYLRSGSSLGQYEIPGLRERIQALQYRQQHVNEFVFNPNYSDAAGKGIFANQVSAIGDPLKIQTEQTDILTDLNGGIQDINTRLRKAGFGTE